MLETDALCTNCGLCCTGTLFDYGKLGVDEVETSRAAGLDVFDHSEVGPAFRIACPRLEGSRCSVYEVRPRACRKFRCKLLCDVEGGNVAIAVALDRVAEARALVDKIVAGLTGGETLNEARWRWRSSAPGWWIGDLSAAQFHLEMTMLNLLLDRHFRNKEQWVMVGDQ